MNSRKPTLISPITPNTRATISSRQMAAENADRDRSRDASMKVHSSSEPSCDPQVAAKRYCSGNLRVGVLRDIEHREIVSNKRIGKTEECDGDKHELPLHDRAGEGNPGGDATGGADDGQGALYKRQQQARGSEQNYQVLESW